MNELLKLKESKVSRYQDKYQICLARENIKEDPVHRSSSSITEIHKKLNLVSILKQIIKGGTKSFSFKFSPTCCY